MLSCCLTLTLKMNKTELKLVVRRSEVLLFEVPTARRDTQRRLSQKERSIHFKLKVRALNH